MKEAETVRYVKRRREDFGYGQSCRKKAFSPGVDQPLCGWSAIEGRTHPRLTKAARKVKLCDDQGTAIITTSRRGAVRRSMKDLIEQSNTQGEVAKELPRQGDLFSV